MEILVLGGTGAMGVPLVNKLAEMGHHVLVTSRKKRDEQNTKISYLTGNAHEKDYMGKLLKSHRYDAIVDFMTYTPEEFLERSVMLLEATDHYVFLSSARVYADSDNQINEDSPRLLDICSDTEYVLTNEYAIAKAKSEDILRSSGKMNWTIIRPYITYFDNRLQLGILEKEQWLYRALSDRTIVFSKDIAESFTTLTWGGDVAFCIANCVDGRLFYGDVLNPVTSETVQWKTILEIYCDSIEKYAGKRPKVIFAQDSSGTIKILGNKYQYIYDRLFHRSFDNTKAEITGVHFKSTAEGIDRCIYNFLNSTEKFGAINYELEAYYDRLAGEWIKPMQFPTWKKMIRYYAMRIFQIRF